MKANETNGFYEFGEFRIDLKKRRLWRGEELIPLTPKEFELLLTLVENAGRILDKDDLLEKVWAGTFVGEGTLTRNISWLRKKLGDEKMIETLPRRGYRFLPEVTKIETPAQALIVEEQSLRQITIEETISIPENGNEHLAFPSNAIAERSELDEIEKIRIPKSENGNRWFWLAAIGGIIFVFAVAFAFYQFILPKQTPQTVPVSRVVPFSGLAGRETTPAFSPDGKQIAFAWNGGEGEQLDIYVKLVGAGEPLRLTTNEADELFPAFSPDGRFVAFVRSQPTASEICLIPALGGAERKIARLNSIRTSFSWSPDGKMMAVVDAEASGKSNGIFLLNIENGEKRRVTSPPELSSDDMPRISPDGRQIAFVRVFGTTIYEIFAAPIEKGAEAKQLTFDKAGIHGLTWSADGKHIVFASQRASGQSNLWQIAPEGGEPRLIATGGKNIASPAISPDGKIIAFTEESSDINLWQIAPGSTARKIIASSRADHSQNFSPDGKKIVFTSDRTGSFQIWLADADGKNQRQLTDSENPAGSPRFSPDGKFIAYDAQIAGKGEIFVIPAEGGTPRRLTDSAEIHDVLPAWSADGKFIFFTSNKSSDFQIWKIASDGNGEPVQITRQGAFESAASSDGREIFFTKARGVSGLWRVSVEGGEEAPVSELAEAGYWRYWQVAQNGIYFVRRSSNAPYKIEFYDFASKTTREIAAFERPPIWIFSGFAVSPDGKSILYAQHDQIAASIMLAELSR